MRRIRSHSFAGFEGLFVRGLICEVVAKGHISLAWKLRRLRLLGLRLQHIGLAVICNSDRRITDAKWIAARKLVLIHLQSLCHELGSMRLDSVGMLLLLPEL